MSQTDAPAAELCAIESRDSFLRVRFNWSGDRYGHAIDLMEENQIRVLLQSVEGDERDDWPPSPPFQRVNVSRIASDTENRRVAMLVGAAGTSHWSMCVAVCDRLSVLREGDAREFLDTELVFDIACRAQQTPRWLGNTYRALAAPVAISKELNCACVPVTPPRCLVLTHGVRLEMDTCSGLLPLLRCQARDSESLDRESPTTFRWRYTLRFLGSTPRDVDRFILRTSA